MLVLIPFRCNELAATIDTKSKVVLMAMSTYCVNLTDLRIETIFSAIKQERHQFDKETQKTNFQIQV